MCVYIGGSNCIRFSSSINTLIIQFVIAKITNNMYNILILYFCFLSVINFDINLVYIGIYAGSLIKFHFVQHCQRFFGFFWYPTPMPDLPSPTNSSTSSFVAN